MPGQAAEESGQFCPIGRDRYRQGWSPPGLVSGYVRLVFRLNGEQWHRRRTEERHAEFSILADSRHRERVCVKLEPKVVSILFD